MKIKSKNKRRPKLPPHRVYKNRTGRKTWCFKCGAGDRECVHDRLYFKHLSAKKRHKPNKHKSTRSKRERIPVGALVGAAMVATIANKL